MTSEETRKAIEVIQAWLDGKQIERSPKRNSDVGWIRILRRHAPQQNGPDWDFDSQHYRIQPEPMEIEVWVHPDGRICSDGRCGAIHTLPWEKKKFREVLE